MAVTPNRPFSPEINSTYERLARLTHLTRDLPANIRDLISEVVEAATISLEDLQVVVEDLDDLRQGVAQAVVQPRRQHQNPIAQRGLRQSIGHGRLDVLSAARAPIAMDRMFGDHGRDVFGDVLGVPFSCLLATLERSATSGTAWETVRPLLIDSFGRGPATAWMSGFLSRLLGTRMATWLSVRRHHSQRCGRRSRGDRWRRLLGQRQQSKDDRLLALAINLPGLLFGEQRSQRNGLQRLRRSFHTMNYRTFLPNNYNL